MATEISVYVCDTAKKAVSAKQFLLANGYAVENITNEKAQVLVYDATTYSTHGTSDSVSNKFIVIGRR